MKTIYTILCALMVLCVTVDAQAQSTKSKQYDKWIQGKPTAEAQEIKKMLFETVPKWYADKNTSQQLWEGTVLSVDMTWDALDQLKATSNQSLLNKVQIIKILWTPASKAMLDPSYFTLFPHLKYVIISFYEDYKYEQVEKLLDSSMYNQSYEIVLMRLNNPK